MLPSPGKRLNYREERVSKTALQGGRQLWEESRPGVVAASARRPPRWRPVGKGRFPQPACRSGGVGLPHFILNLEAVKSKGEVEPSDSWSVPVARSQ